MTESRGIIIDGKSVAEEILKELSASVAIFSSKFRAPRLAAIIVGENPASQAYVASKARAAERCGISSVVVELPEKTDERTLLDRIDRLNEDEEIDAILVQMPLPQHINEQTVIEQLSPEKDVDGLHPCNLGRLVSDRSHFIPCTPLGIITLLERYHVKTEGARAVVIGRSILVGKPTALLLARRHPIGNASVTLCHSKSRELSDLIREADIVIAAMGKPKAITADMIKEGAVVIDVGINRVSDPLMPKGYRICGDVDFEKVREKASLITPVPGGVGPMTVAMLMQNTLQAAVRAHDSRNE